MNALTALCASLGVLPGRKTIVFFAESLAVPPAVEGRFHRLIDMANRENVAVYSVDAAGLRVHSEQAAVGRRTTAAGVASMDASASSPFGGGGTSDVFDMISRDSERRPQHSLESNRRIPDLQHERPLAWAPRHRPGPPPLLPADLLAEERGAGREAPADSR